MDVPLLNMRSMENVAPCVPPVQYKCLIQILYDKYWNTLHKYIQLSFPVAQLVEHGISNAKIMGSIPRESKS